MQLPHKINIDLEQFLLTGQFDYVQLGQTKAWLNQNFADPDSKNDMGHSLSIWLYGRIEFHFDGDRLYCIFCDYLADYLDGGEHLELNSWWLNQQEQLELSLVIQQLLIKQANFKVIHKPDLNSIEIFVEKSGIKLFFHQQEHQENSETLFYLGAFSLSHHAHND